MQRIAMIFWLYLIVLELFRMLFFVLFLHLLCGYKCLLVSAQIPFQLFSIGNQMNFFTETVTLSH